MKKIILSFFALLLLGSTAKAQESYAVESINLPKGGEAELQVAYNFEERDCKGLQFNIDLPAGLEFVKKSSKIVSAQGFVSEDNITVNLDAQGSLLVTWFSGDGTPIKRKKGIVVALKVRATGSPDVGEVYNCLLKKAKRTLPNGSTEQLGDVPFTVTIADPADYDVLLDENSLFEPEDTEEEETVDILVKRTINAGEWSTICFPFDLGEETFTSIFGDDAILAEFVKFSKDTDGSTPINFTLAYEIEANTPYLIKTTKNITSFRINAPIGKDDVKAGRPANGFFYGTYKACTPVLDNDVDYIVLSNNQFYYSTGLVWIKGFRGYFYYKNSFKDNANARFFISIDGSDATKIQNAQISKNETGKVYSISGRYMGEKVNMKSLPKGVYVVDGVKVINK